jgi:hypothetical protein
MGAEVYHNLKSLIKEKYGAWWAPTGVPTSSVDQPLALAMRWGSWRRPLVGLPAPNRVRPQPRPPPTASPANRPRPGRLQRG